ncbi:MAG: 16S rRNA (uracil(1498)-N(3))-methyltransferase [Rhodospirillales bacterium]|nr:16S rRNA (uracil(1498)-N(3))-methyltransferase [Rhodospirillales bacterium]
MGVRRGSGAKIRLFVAAGLAAGAAVPLSPAQAHYAGKVMRLSVGDSVLLFNGRDGEWRARIDSLGRKGGEAVAETRTRAQVPAHDPWLLFAPLKKTATDFMIEKATELGVALLQPVMTRRTSAERVNVERLRAQAAEAAEQCERLTVPGVRPMLTLERAMADWNGARRLFVADETGGGVPAAEAFSGAAPSGPVAFLVGPEGGFERSELDALSRFPFVTRVALGPRILRAETAALALLACWQALAGDGRSPPPPRE